MAERRIARAELPGGNERVSDYNKIKARTRRSCSPETTATSRCGPQIRGWLRPIASAASRHAAIAPVPMTIVLVYSGTRVRRRRTHGSKAHRRRCSRRRPVSETLDLYTPELPQGSYLTTGPGRSDAAGGFRSQRRSSFLGSPAFVRGDSNLAGSPTRSRPPMHSRASTRRRREKPGAQARSPTSCVQRPPTRRRFRSHYVTQHPQIRRAFPHQAASCATCR